MKKRLTLREFKKYYGESDQKCISFDSDNQDWQLSSCKFRLIFSSMLVGENPNIIFLQNGKNIISLSMVKYVEIDTEMTVLGTVFRVHCGENGDKTVYTLISA